MKYCRLFAFLTALIILLSVSSCAFYSEDDFGGGVKVDDNVIDAAKNLSEGTDASKYTEVTDASGQRIVFWTDGGSVYHKFAECSSLQKSKNINSDSIDSAAIAGKTRGCSNCTD